ncbi:MULTISPECIES: alpha/beta hydrolase [Anaerotruncus]|uniref:alpha/beta hydrolase n=1 Tax=Anaerotruncus TaxID=244127 RepID=UPI00082DC172|nr:MULTISPECIES: alpha/beta hydrolase [Anaerotruncus]RGX54347.1 steryl acetyl hydrolase [Anaerotruncus sp. AF02-27]
MAFNKAVRAILRALSPDLDVTKTYEFERKIRTISSGRHVKLFYRPWDHVVIAGDHTVPVRIFTPETEGEHPILLFFHGGGWVTGNIDTYDRACTHMAKLTGHVVVSVDYRLAPEHPFPAGLEDCYAVARDIFLDAQLLGVPAESITLIGDSAGGNLAAALSLLARDRGEFLPRRQILLYPATYNDHTARSPFPSVRENGEGYILTAKRIGEYMELYASCGADRKSPYFAPLLAEDLSGQPDTLIITAQYDPLRDEGEAYGKKLLAEGNRVKIHRIGEALHGFITLPPTLRVVKEAYGVINEFLSEVIEP